MPDPYHMTLTLPLRTVSETNMRQSWPVRHRRAKAQRQAVYLALRQAVWPAPPLPLTVTLTRISPRMLDGDNLVSSFKGCVDGASDWLAGAYLEGQDRQEGLTFAYAQRRGLPREYAVEITTETA